MPGLRSRVRKHVAGRLFTAVTAGKLPAARYLRWALIYSLVVLALLAAYWRLPYKSSLLTSASLEQVLAPPKSSFAIGSMRWDLRAYTTDPHLEPLRVYFRSVAGTQKGVAAALAVSRDFVARFPFGNAPRECFSRSFDPVEDLNEHLRGAPGHCVTRSSLASAVLLSAGIPARMVQLSTDTPTGHNVFEVWDQHEDWVMVDPTYGGMLKMGNNLCSAVEAQLYGGAATWTQAAPPASEAVSPSRLYSPRGQDVLRAPLVYPEPWLYMRTGPRESEWPFRGRFAVVGPTSWNLGIAQLIFRFAIVTFALLAAACFSLGLLLRTASNKRAGAVGGAVVEPVRTA
jgi:hypothetical protein